MVKHVVDGDRDIDLFMKASNLEYNGDPECAHHEEHHRPSHRSPYPPREIPENLSPNGFLITISHGPPPHGDQEITGIKGAEIKFPTSAGKREAGIEPPRPGAYIASFPAPSELTKKSSNPPFDFL
jgi:hypothetical protein